MSNDFVAKLRARRERVEAEMQGRLDELDQAIKLAMLEARPPSRSAERKSGRRTRATTVDDIFEPEILQALLTMPIVTTADIERLLPGQGTGPVVNAWTRRSQAAGVEFTDLIEKTRVPGRRFGYSLTDKGREVLGAVSTSSPEP